MLDGFQKQQFVSHQHINQCFSKSATSRCADLNPQNSTASHAGCGILGAEVHPSESGQDRETLPQNASSETPNNYLLLILGWDYTSNVIMMTFS